MKILLAIYAIAGAITTFKAGQDDRRAGLNFNFIESALMGGLIGLLWPLRCWIWFVDWKDSKIENDYR